MMQTNTTPRQMLSQTTTSMFQSHAFIAQTLVLSIPIENIISYKIMFNYL